MSKIGRREYTDNPTGYILLEIDKCHGQQKLTGYIYWEGLLALRMAIIDIQEGVYETTYA